MNQSSKLEKSAQTLRQVNKEGENADHSKAADAQNDVDRPENAKGRPATGRQSNAGNDGGA